MRFLVAPLGTLVLASCAAATPALEPVKVDPSGRGFILADSGQAFSPWGFNYDHDEASRLLEDYWESDWVAVEGDFREMKELGANVVRVHLQTGKFLEAPDRANDGAIAWLRRLLALAEKVEIRLDITGLGCYRKSDVPPWYDALSEEARWEAQATFWEAVAAACARSHAVFCYDLMNEPVVPGGRRQPGDWLGPPFGEYHYVQVVTLDQAGRPRPEIARAWIERLVRAIRKQDERHLITVGLVDWSLDRPGLTSGFVPEKVAPLLDFLCVHIYPEAGKVEDALETLKGFAAGKPVVIEETFPLQCSIPEFRRFLSESRRWAAGWIGFYWGTTPEEYRQRKDIQAALMLGWLELFREIGAGGGSK
jgi:sugar phosphate isomerase/epimerase